MLPTALLAVGELDQRAQIDQLVVISVFVVILAMWCMGVTVWYLRRSSRVQKVEQRLGLAEPSGGPARVLRLWHEGRQATTMVPSLTRRSSLVRRLNQLSRDAGWNLPGATLILGALGASTGLFALMFALTSSVLPGAAGAVLPPLAAWTYLQYCIHKRLGMFERQLVDALELAARSLRAGHPLVGAFHLISEEIGDPVSTVFAEICQQQAMGVGLEDALAKVAAGTGNLDMKLFATSVVIQLRSGGNLADMMERLAFVIRDRMRLNRKFRVLTAQTQLSKRVLLALPIVTFFLLCLLNPDYMRPLYETQAGVFLMVGACVSLAVGWWMMNRLSRLRY